MSPLQLSTLTARADNPETSRLMLVLSASALAFFARMNQTHMKRFPITGLLFLGISFGWAKAALADGFVDNGGVFAKLPGVAYGINDGGQVVGAFSGDQGFVDTGGVLTTFNYPGYPGFSFGIPWGINDSGQVVGTFYGSTGDHGFVDTGGVFTTANYPGAAQTGAHGINDSGQIVGYFSNATGADQGFVDTGGVFSTVNFPGASVTVCLGINDSGQIVGYFEDTGELAQGFVDTGGVFTRLNYPDASNTDLFGINDGAQIVGSYDHLVTPEPSSWVLMCSLIVGLFIWNLRRRLKTL